MHLVCRFFCVFDSYAGLSYIDIRKLSPVRNRNTCIDVLTLLSGYSILWIFVSLQWNEIFSDPIQSVFYRAGDNAMPG